jgi:threonylcarbamoyladenosine tRNA methylthiotransferase MtaB
VGLRIAFKTLGFRLNQYETDALVTDFNKAGHQLGSF